MVGNPTVLNHKRCLNMHLRMTHSEGSFSMFVIDTYFHIRYANLTSSCFRPATSRRGRLSTPRISRVDRALPAAFIRANCSVHGYVAPREAAARPLAVAGLDAVPVYRWPFHLTSGQCVNGGRRFTHAHLRDGHTGERPLHALSAHTRPEEYPRPGHHPMTVVLLAETGLRA